MTDEDRAKNRDLNAQQHRDDRSSMTDEDRAKNRDLNAQQQRDDRSSLTDEDRAKNRDLNAQQHRDDRSSMTDEDRAKNRDLNAQQQRDHRSSMTDEDRAKNRDLNAQQHRDDSSMTDEDRAKNRDLNAQQHRDDRSNMTDEDRAKNRDLNAQQQRDHRNYMTDEVRATNRDLNAQQHRDDRNNRRHRFIPFPELPAAISNGIVVPEHYCGDLNVLCEFCQSKNFTKERPSDGKFTICCQKGRVNLEPIRRSELIENLMTGKHEESKNFMANIRSYNSSLAFVSMGAKIVPPPGHGPYCFRIHGQIYHRTGTLIPENDEVKQFAQLYILDPTAASEERMRLNENQGCLPALMMELSTYMTQINWPNKLIN